MSARRIVIAFAAVSVVGWLLGITGVTHLPSAGYVVSDIVGEALLLVGLWLLWRPAWVVAVVGTALGELLFVFHPLRHAALLVIGVAQLALLTLPQLRRELGKRPVG